MIIFPRINQGILFVKYLFIKHICLLILWFDIYNIGISDFYKLELEHTQKTKKILINAIFYELYIK